MDEQVVDVVRPFFSLDYDDILSILLGLIALILWYRTKRLPGTQRTENIGAGVLEQFSKLFDRIGILEADLAAAKIGLQEARAEIREMRKIEEFLQGKLYEKDKEVQQLRSQLDAARERIRHLEHVCRRAGINGELELD